MKNKSAEKNIVTEKQRSGPITKKEEVAENPDNKIDQDFPGFPHGHSSEKVIHPVTPAEKKTAAINIKGQKTSSSKK